MTWKFTSSSWESFPVHAVWLAFVWYLQSQHQNGEERLPLAMADNASFTHSVCFCGEFWAMVDCYRGCRGWPAEMVPPEWEGEGGREAHAIQASSVLLIENSASEGLTFTIKVVVGLETRAFRTPYSTTSSLYHRSSRYQYPQSSLIPSSTWVLGALAYKQPKEFFPPFWSLDLSTSVPLLVWFSLCITLAFLSPVLSTQPHCLQNYCTTPVFKVLLQYLAQEATFPDSFLFTNSLPISHSITCALSSKILWFVLPKICLFIQLVTSHLYWGFAMIWVLCYTSKQGMTTSSFPQEPRGLAKQACDQT